MFSSGSNRLAVVRFEIRCVFLRSGFLIEKRLFYLIQKAHRHGGSQTRQYASNMERNYTSR
uniref:Uncharacterized protein n=1 Tax=Leptospira ellisii TaxID=2023197 RepID=A0A2N0B656_9LEPT|nr:hypothetical protein CH379_15430 [Leptospira ellisii]